MNRHPTPRPHHVVGRRWLGREELASARREGERGARCPGEALDRVGCQLPATVGSAPPTTYRGSVLPPGPPTRGPSHPSRGLASCVEKLIELITKYSRFQVFRRKLSTAMGKFAWENLVDRYDEELERLAHMPCVLC